MVQRLTTLWLLIAAVAFAGCTPTPQVTAPSVKDMEFDQAKALLEEEGFKVDVEDRSGDDRAVMVHSNWIVVEQVPAAGALIDEDGTILALVMKAGELGGAGLPDSTASASNGPARSDESSTEPSPSSTSADEGPSYLVVHEIQIDRNQTNRYAVVTGTDPARSAIDCSNEINDLDVESYCWVFASVDDFEAAGVDDGGYFDRFCWAAEAGAGVSTSRVTEAQRAPTMDVACPSVHGALPTPQSDLEICEVYLDFASEPSPVYADFLSSLAATAEDTQLRDSLAADSRLARDGVEENHPGVLDRCVDLGA